MKRNLSAGILLLVMTMTVAELQATVITVRQDGTGDFTTIQDALNASSAGDTVLVWPGVYYENIVLPGHPVTLASLLLTTGNQSYVAATVIDGGHNNPCVRINNGPQVFTTIRGFTCTNGKGYGATFKGGGIYIKKSSVNVSDCIVMDNWAASAGGGIYLDQSEVILSGCIIKYNHCIRLAGGLCIADSEVEFDTIRKNSIYLNYAGMGSDIYKSYMDGPMSFQLDTFTVIDPDVHYIFSCDSYGYPLNDIQVTIGHGKIEAVNADLYVAPWGDDGNGGLEPGNPLRSVSFAFKKTVSDSLHPNTIRLAPGVYSPSLTGEKFPLSFRSYVSLTGQDTSNTILDAEHLSKFGYGANNTRNYAVRNLTLRNGFGNVYQVLSGDNSGIQVWVNFDIEFENLHFMNGTGWGNGIQAQLDSYGLFKGIWVENGIGGGGLNIGNGQPGSNIVDTRYFVINCLFDNLTPDPAYIHGGGGNHFGGVYQNPDKEIGYICNTQVTSTILGGDPFFGDGGGCAIDASNNARLFIINSTIGDCKVLFVNGGALGTFDGPVIDLYNTVMYHDEPHEIMLGTSSPYQQPTTLGAWYNNIQGGFDGIVNSWNMHFLHWGAGNTNQEPQWLGSGDYPYALSGSSPCIDKGVPMYSPGMIPPYIIQQDTVYSLVTNQWDTIPLPSRDLAGNPRIINGRIDIGAYEYCMTGEEDSESGAPEPPQISLYPNPFTENIFIVFVLKEPASVRITISDMAGRQVKTLADARMSAGRCRLVWDGTGSNGSPLPPGGYIITLTKDDRLAGTVKAVRKK